jgi:hypothetical protein
MRYYIVVEGRSSEIKIYPKWIHFLNETLTQIYDLRDTIDNAFYLVSGDGYPNYLEIIKNAVEDVNAIGNFDCLVVAVDSENTSYQEKYDEIKKIVGGNLKSAELKIIVQHFCIETWVLGNRVACRKNAQDKTLLEYRSVHDVRNADPELLPAYKDMNRAQFAYSYLRCILRDWYPGAVYTKAKPAIILDEGYFSQIKKRLESTMHIQSFKAFLDAFAKSEEIFHA